MLVGFTSALRGLTTNKLRSFLTMLGVIFGVAAVIVAVALGQGSKDAAIKRFQKFGTTSMSVIPGKMGKGGVTFGTKSTLKLTDADAILRGAPSVRNVSAEKSANTQVKYLNKNTDTTVYGCGDKLLQIRKYDLKDGKFFTAEDVKAKRMVCVLGSEVYKNLFGTDPCVGKRIYIKGQSFTVLGSLVERGGGGFFNEDDRVYMPVTTVLRRLVGSEDVLSSMSVEGRSEGQMQKAQDEVTEVLKKRHKIGSTKPNDFMIFNAGTAAAQSNAQAADFEQLINCLAAVALIVGGIGIMNIMLVSVTERTREIGVRKAIGAKRRDILAQFMMEAMFLSLTGGLIGAIGGVAFTLYGLPYLKPDWETSLSLFPTLVAFSFSAVIGIFFGFYPALKASKLNPIEALRYE